MDRKKTIVLVDNDKAALEDWARILREDGYEVLKASSVKSAKKRLGKADLAIVDLRLEREEDENDLSGLSLAVEAKNSSVPVIILTGVQKKTAEGAVRALQRNGRVSSAVEVVDKKKGGENLLKVVRRFIVPKVFLVHGHDEVARQAIVECLEGQGFRVIVLQDEPGASATLIQKVDRYSNAHFAVILVTPDDLGGLRAEPTIQNLRARQNVVFEYGFFLGRLGQSHVMAVHSGDKVELPSDCDGIHCLSMDPRGRWRDLLLRELESALDLVGLSG